METGAMALRAIKPATGATLATCDEMTLLQVGGHRRLRPQDLPCVARHAFSECAARMRRAAEVRPPLNRAGSRSCMFCLGRCAKSGARRDEGAPAAAAVCARASGHRLAPH